MKERNQLGNKEERKSEISEDVINQLLPIISLKKKGKVLFMINAWKKLESIKKK